MLPRNQPAWKPHKAQGRWVCQCQPVSSEISRRSLYVEAILQERFAPRAFLVIQWKQPLSLLGTAAAVPQARAARARRRGGGGAGGPSSAVIGRGARRRAGSHAGPRLRF